MDRSIIVSRKHSEEKETLAVQMRRNMTAAEKALWERLRRNQLGGLHFRRQQIIDGFIADFYCHAAKPVIEADGGVHDAQAEYDLERDKIIATHDLIILRFSNRQILTDMSTVLAHIETAALQRLSDPPLEEGPGEVIL